MTAQSKPGPAASGTPRPRRRFAPAVHALLVLVPLGFSAAPVLAQPVGASLIPGASPDSVAPTPWSLARLEPGGVFEGTVDPKAYRIGPGDELALDVVGRLSASATAVVDPEGELSIPDFGRLHVAGLTLEEARTAVRRMFHGKTRGIEAYLRLVRVRRIKVYASGMVRNPGTLEVTPQTRASEVLERAGGPLDGASLRNITFRAPDGHTRSVDLMRFERMGDRSANPFASDGDQLFVPQAGEHLYAYGPLPFSGSYEFRPGDRLSDLVAMAGGLMPQADAAHARLLRFHDDATVDSLAVDLPAVMAGAHDLSLEPGDRLFVPARTDYHVDRHVTLAGEVVRPGVYPLREGEERLSDAIRAAGGFTPEAARYSVLLLRADGQPLDRDTDFQRMSRLSRGEMTSSEYEVFRTKLASAQTTFVVDATHLPGFDSDPVDGRRPGSATERDRDVLLQANDVIRVGRVDFSVRVTGRVRRPGLVAYAPGLDGRRYIEMAGGFAAGAAEGKARVTRSSTGQTLALRDVPQIDPGDLIYVPEHPDRNWLAGLRDVLLVAGSVATVVIAFRR